jgi:hypothetical protein
MRLKHSAEVPRSPPTRENSPSRPLPGRSCCFASNQLSRKRKPVSFATLGIPRIQSFWGTKGSSPYVDSTERMEEVTDTRGRCPSRTQRCRVHGRMDRDDGDHRGARPGALRKDGSQNLGADDGMDRQGRFSGFDPPITWSSFARPDSPGRLSPHVLCARRGRPGWVRDL